VVVGFNQPLIVVDHKEWDVNVPQRWFLWFTYTDWDNAINTAEVNLPGAKDLLGTSQW